MDDDDHVYDEEEEEKLSIPQQIEIAQRQLASKKRKLDQLDEQIAKENRDEQFALHRVNLYNAYQALGSILNDYPAYITLLHTRALQVCKNM